MPRIDVLHCSVLYDDELVADVCKNAAVYVISLSPSYVCVGHQTMLFTYLFH